MECLHHQSGEIIHSNDFGDEKRPPNAFILFLRECRETVSQSNQELSDFQVDNLIAKMWISADETIKNEFREKAKANYEKFKSEHPDYFDQVKKKKPILVKESNSIAEPIKIKVILNQNFS